MNVEAKTETPEPEELPQFFGTDEDADPFDDGEGEFAEPAEEPVGDEPVGEVEDTPATVPYRRLQKVVAQRNAERERAAELEAAVNEANVKLAKHEQFIELVGARYAKFRNPTAQAARDADFMDAMEEMAKSDATVAQFYNKVTQYMENGSSRPAPETKATEPASDTRVDRLIEREARRTAEDALAPFKLMPKFQKLILDHVVANAKDAAALTATETLKLAKGWLATSGFTMDELREKPAKKPEPDARPRSSRSGAAGGDSKTKKPAPEAKKFESREDLLKDRQRRLDELISELESAR